MAVARTVARQGLRQSKSNRWRTRSFFLPFRPCGARASMTAKHPRSKGPKRSLNGRKREKDVSRALLENCFRPEQVEFKKANWESAVPRKMQIIMNAAAHAAAGTPRRSKEPREDLPRDPSQSKRSKAARAAEKAAKATAAPALPLSGQKAAPAPLPTAAPAAPAARAARPPDEPKAEPSRAPPKQPETAAMEAERLRTDAHALGATLTLTLTLNPTPTPTLTLTIKLTPNPNPNPNLQGAALSARKQSHRKAAQP